ncbi:type II toxin-antitoxin system RatA family toxin [Ponticaulis profundi]|uniref:Type II toxin-antitoxin system RatA family toxin n=1 Tax=Ponticaulis profundi TaxID=2665222 RepID=A0ABW1SFD8_9PROT
MTRFRRVVRINHDPDNLFELVSGIEQYPEFIKWVQKMDVSPVEEDGVKSIKIGSARVGFANFTETFSTQVVSDAETRHIKVSLEDGPLKHLENEWTFKPAESGTDIEFFIDFEFKNFILRALAAANFELAVNRIMAAFVAEADRRYGNKS